MSLQIKKILYLHPESQKIALFGLGGRWKNRWIFWMKWVDFGRFLNLLKSGIPQKLRKDKVLKDKD